MPKLSFKKDYYLKDSWEDKGVQTFPKSICLKGNVIARLVFELKQYDSTVQRFNHYNTWTPPPRLPLKTLRYCF